MNKEAQSAYDAASRLASDGNHFAALAQYRKAIAADESDTRYWVAFGISLLALHHWQEAVKALTHGIELKPAYAEADARLYLAEAFVGAGDLGNAIAQWKIVAAMRPTYPSWNAPIEEAKSMLKKSEPNKTLQPTAPKDGASVER